MATRMRVAYDLDGMGYDALQRWLDRINEDWGTHVAKEDARDWDVAKAFEGLVPKKAIYDYLHEPGMFLLGATLPGFKEAVQASVEADDEVLILSAPSGPLSAKEKLEWCAAELPFVDFGNVMLGGNKSVVRADALLDDRPKTLVEFRQENPSALCAGILYPYNANFPAGTIMVPDYRDTAAAWATLVGMLNRHREMLRGQR